MILPNALRVEYLRLDLLKNYHRQLRIPSKKQLEKTTRMIRECGFMPPVIIDGDNCIVIGAHIAAAAHDMGFEEVPAIRIGHLDDVQIQTLRIAYDRIASEATWSQEALAEEFRDLMIKFPDIDLTITGFEIPEIDLFLDPPSLVDPDDDFTAPEGPAIVQPGELWKLGDHLLYCGDALMPESYQALMGDEKAQVCFTDSPYNVKIAGHVGNSGKIKHREFLQGAGELDQAGFTTFLYQAHQLMADHSQDGAILFSCMDWRHLMEIMTAGAKAGLDLQNLCVWAKDNGGMGSLYRSRHELVLVFKKGNAKHINNVELGKYGRYRTNVWEYPGVNSFGGGRMDELALHPTVKPLALVADALKDCSKRGGIVLDPFGGSGTTLIAAEKTGRKARLVELDPLYCDVIIRRWQKVTGKEAINTISGKSFGETQTGGGRDE